MEEELSHWGLGVPSLGDDNVKHLAVFSGVGKLPPNNSVHDPNRMISFSPFEKDSTEKQMQINERGWSAVSKSETRIAPTVRAQFAARHLSAAANASPPINSELSFRSLSCQPDGRMI